MHVALASPCPGACPLSAFSLCSGKPLNLPAYEPVPVYTVVIDGDDVMIDPSVTKDVSAL